MRNTTRRVVLAAASTGVAAVSAAGVTAAPAHAAPVCNADVVSITSWDLSDNDGNDEIKVKLGDSPWAGPWDMPDNWTRNASLGNLDKDFTDELVIRLAEQDLTRHEIGRRTVECTEDVGQHLFTLVGDGATYDMVVNVTQH
jgi:hypothetical protein